MTAPGIVPPAPERRTQFTLAQMPVPMVHATHRIIRDCNGEFAALFGFERAELIDQSFSHLYPRLDDFVRTGDMWRSNFAGGRVYYDERIMIGAAGSRFWCRVNGRSLADGDPFAEALYCFEPMSRPLENSASALTGRQRQVLTLIAQGKTNVRIAEELGVSKRTVEGHRARLMRTVGVHNSAELVAWFTAAQ